MREGSEHAKSTVKCDALLVDTVSRSDTYPYVDVREDDVEMGHEASVSKISEDQPFYLMSRGMTEDEAMATIVRGFVEPIAGELPMEYALELNRLIELQMEGGSASALTRGLFLLCALAAKVLPVAGDVLAVVVGALWYTSALWYDNGFHLPAP